MKLKFLILLLISLWIPQDAQALQPEITVGNTLVTPIGNLSIGTNPVQWDKKVAIALVAAMIAIPIIIKTTPWFALKSKYLSMNMAYDDHGKRKPGYLWSELEKLQLPFKINAKITI